MRTGSTLLLAALGLAACSKLTEPPKPEPVETTGAAPTDGDQAKKDAMRKNALELLASASAASAAAQPPPTPPPPTNEKLESKDVVAGKGAEAKTGDTVTVHYVGTLPD